MSEQLQHQRGSLGWIEVICGSMFSGKSEELIRRRRRAQIARQRVQIFKPRMDDRYSERVIVAGLDQDFRGKPFDPMPQLLAIAEYITNVDRDERFARHVERKHCFGVRGIRDYYCLRKNLRKRMDACRRWVRHQQRIF